MSDATVVAFESWQAPDLSRFKEKELDATTIAALRQSAYDEGFAQGLSEGDAQGFKAGEARGLALTQDRADQFLALLQGIDAPLVAMDAHLAREVAHLAALVGAELARSQITVDAAAHQRSPAVVTTSSQNIFASRGPSDGGRPYRGITG